ncbi:LppU/SCO3897 family protein [Nocardia macrotermitis]|uniref:Uncharacterized protein n=1 Tax=Nocardia macrotermitis TaxID=2585198 RepID=A0A7K0D419_9NOCA|nr:hypothetical protein [Nocardia macrotermitis]MQY20485.1 hypothetical protein [Nocardia macrotermitis]
MSRAGFRRWRAGMRCGAGVFVLLPVVGFLVACSAVSGPVQHGDCLKKNGDSFDKVSCSDSAAAYVVLDRAGDGHAQKDCIDVAGTEYDYYDSGDSVCVGDKGADTAHAVNVAQIGDCLTGSEGSSVLKVACTDATARYKVLGRETASMIGLNMECKGVKGTERTYSFELKATKGIGAGLGHGVTFCLADKDADTSRTVDNAKVGDCLQETGANDVRIVACGSSDAKYKVLRSVPVSSLCDNVSGVTATYSYKSPGELMKTYLCLGSP